MEHRMFGDIDQIGHVVDDLDAAIGARLALGIGPWTIFRSTELKGSYRGDDTCVTIDVGLAYLGSMQIELIQQRGTAPSPYHGPTGPHHVGWVVDDLAQAVTAAQAQGLVPVFYASNTAVCVAYLESPAEPGSYYELIEGTGMRTMIEKGIATAKLWDGSDPITEISMSKA